MHKNRIIVILGIFIVLIPELGFTSGNKKLLIQSFAAIIVILAFLIERKGVFSLHWRKKNPVTPVAHTYVERNGAARLNDDKPIDNLQVS